GSTSFCINLEVRSKPGFNITVITNGNGTVTTSPNQPNYSLGSNILITASPEVGWDFEKWTGDTTATINPLTVHVSGNKTITANNDKLNTAANILSFTLSDSATVYIGYDSRAAVLPAWLNTWKAISGKVNIDDPKLTHFNIYSKNYPANSQVYLGGNLANPA